jgi:hypothetical protein
VGNHEQHKKSARQPIKKEHRKTGSLKYSFLFSYVLDLLIED